ncbi:MAG: tetratricopeptide repeat protein [Myxococcaceae bacterium]|nr:tetratricopeptide repeat protein [Myxococcaceae bacterium]
MALAFLSMAHSRKRSRSQPAALAKKKVKAKSGGTLPFEIDPAQLDDTLEKLKTQLVDWANKGRYTKVRFKFRGKQLLPDIPLAAVAAVEGVTFYWGGLLRALVFNLAGKTVLDVELINDSERKLHEGKEQLLAGELEAALTLFNQALAMERTNPKVHLNLGVAYKLKGDLSAARKAFKAAMALDAHGPSGHEAERKLKALEGTPSVSDE